MKKAEILCLCIAVIFLCLTVSGCGEKTAEDNRELVYRDIPVRAFSNTLWNIR